MPILTDVPAPWDIPLGTAQHDLIFYSLVVAGLALFAQFIRSWNSTNEVSPRYRSAVYASMCICGVAFLAYVYLVVKFDQAYVLDVASGQYVPTPDSRNTYLPRYMDWSVTVPLLMVEFMAVGALVGAKARSTRFRLMAAAFLMIFTGFLGAGIVGLGGSTAALLIWGAISTVFYIYLYVAMLGVLRSSKGSMGEEAYTSYRNAAILLLSVWGTYPIVYLVHTFLPGDEWTTTIHMSLSFADIAAKVGFGALIHKVAKLRTAEDVAKGEDTHPESVWTSNVKHSDGVQAMVKGMVEEPAFLHHDHDGEHGVRRPVPREAGVSEAASQRSAGRSEVGSRALRRDGGR